MTEHGEGKVIRQNALKETLTLLLDSGEEKEITVQDLSRDRFFKKRHRSKK
jgi:hypothetical protein